MPKAQQSIAKQDFAAKLLTTVRQGAAALSFPPKNVVRCVGIVAFRTQAARDVGCLLDLDPSVISWTCMPTVLTYHRRRHVPEFSVTRSTGVSLVDVIPALRGSKPPDWTQAAALASGYGYETYQEADLRGDVRLENARDLLRYAGYRASLGDRVRVLSVVEDGSVPLATCLQAVRDSRDAIAVVAALALRRFIEIDLDDGRIGPDTRVSAFRG